MLYPFCILSGRYDRTAGRQARMVGGIWAKVSSIVYTSIFRSISLVPQRCQLLFTRSGVAAVFHIR